MTNHPNRNTFSIPVDRKLIADLLSHFGPDPVTQDWCVAGKTTGTRPWVREDDDGKQQTFPLTGAAIRRGLIAMAKEYPRHVGNVLDEDKHDAPLADLFVQCCIFGEEKYA